MKTNCDIIRDLLPLYAEHITSEASNALVEEHLAECEACRAELEQMEQPVPVRPEAQPDAPLRRIRAALQRRSIRAAIGSVLTALCALAMIFWMALPASRPPQSRLISGPTTAKRMAQTSAFWKCRARVSGWIWRHLQLGQAADHCAGHALPLSGRASGTDSPGGF